MATLKQANKAAINQSKLNQLDNLGADVSEFIQVETTNVIESILGDFVERVQNNINSSDIITTGKISDITVEVEGNNVNVYAYPYLIYQDRGVNGAINKLYNTPFSYQNKIPPVEDIKAWIKTKNIQLVYNEKFYGSPSAFANLTDDEKITKTAWAISKGIYKNGVKPKNIFSKEIPQLLEDLGEQIADFTSETIVRVVDIGKK